MRERPPDICMSMTRLCYCNPRMYEPKVARHLQKDTYYGDASDPVNLICIYTALTEKKDLI